MNYFVYWLKIHTHCSRICVRVSVSQIQHCDNTRKKMKNTKVYSSSILKSFKPIEDANLCEKETITSQAALHNVRNLPNILRSNNTKTSRNRKQLNTIDTSFISNAEDGNTSLDSNTTLISVDLEMEANCNKTASSKSHHQRKQVHNPLNMQYDIPDSRSNNKNKNISPTIGELNALRGSSSREKNASTKKKYNNKQKKHSLNKKLKKVTRKSSSKTRASTRKPDTLATIPDVNMKSTVVMQNVNNFLENDTFVQPIYNPNFPNINVNDLYDIGIKSIEPSNISSPNNDIYNVEKKYDINLNHVISFKPTESNTVQRKTVQRDFTSYEFPVTENNLQEPMDRDIGSNFLYEPKILYCSCANCMSHDKDIVFYEDPTSTISTSMSSDETEFFTCDLYTNIYDFYINNYSHIFDDNLMDFEKTNLYCEEFGENNIMKENAYTGVKNTEELIKSNTNMNQNEQSCYGKQDYVEAYSTELATYPNGVRMENIRVFDMDISNYLNSENFSMKENEITPQNEGLIQTVISTDVPVSNSSCQTPENKKGK